MKHLAAYLLLKLGGNDSPSKDDISKALNSVGVQVEDDRLKKLLGDLEGKDLGELLEEGKDLLAKFGGGGGGGGGTFIFIVVREKGSIRYFFLRAAAHNRNILLVCNHQVAEVAAPVEMLLQLKKRKRKRKKKRLTWVAVWICSAVTVVMEVTTKHPCRVNACFSITFCKASFTTITTTFLRRTSLNPQCLFGTFYSV